jgi:hypothetical protein
VTKEDLPPGQPGDPVGRVGPAGKTEANVYRALATHGRVFVIVNFRFACGGPIRQSGGQGRAAEDRALADLSADGFWIMARAAVNGISGPHLMGYASIEGVRKLESQSEVGGIGLEGPPIQIPKVTRRR